MTGFMSPPEAAVLIDMARIFLVNHSIDLLDFDVILKINDSETYALGSELQKLFTSTATDDEDLELKNATIQTLYAYGITQDVLVSNAERNGENELPAFETRVDAQGNFLGAPTRDKPVPETELERTARIHAHNPSEARGEPKPPRTPIKRNAPMTVNDAMEKFTKWATLKGGGQNAIMHAHKTCESFAASHSGAAPEMVSVGPLTVEGREFRRVIRTLQDKRLLTGAELKPRGELKNMILKELSHRGAVSALPRR